MRIPNPFKILGKIDTSIWSCLIQLGVLISIIGLAGVLLILTMGEQ